MKLIAEAKDNQSLFKMEATCSGKGWNQDEKKPCFRLWEINASDIKSRKHTDISADCSTQMNLVGSLKPNKYLNSYIVAVP